MALKHLVRLLTLLAVLFAPASMLGSDMAMAAPQSSQAAAAGSHCAEPQGMDHEAPGGEAPGKSIDCLIACSCVPAFGAQLGARAFFVEAPATWALATLESGLNPQADLPPPRFS